MSRMIDRSGKRYGSLTAVEYVYSDNNGRACWQCVCDCGNEIVVSSPNLQTGNTKSCGCLSLIKDRTGDRYGRLVAMRYTHTGERGNACWECKCDCGNISIVSSGSLQDTQSCGCLQREAASRIGKEYCVKKGENMGVANPNFRHGLYCDKLSSDEREEIRKRDNYTCQDCNKHQDEIGRKLDVHHIDGDDENSDPSNLITLCHGCHNDRTWDMNQIRNGRTKTGDER